MLQTSDQPTLRECIAGWRIVRTGSSQTGDKYWRSYDRVWLPLTSGDPKCGVSVRFTDMPVLIRKAER